MTRLGFPTDPEARQKLAELSETDPFCYGFICHELINGVSQEELVDKITKSAGMDASLAMAWQNLFDKTSAAGGIPGLPNPAKPFSSTGGVSGPTPPSSPPKPTAPKPPTVQPPKPPVAQPTQPPAAQPAQPPRSNDFPIESKSMAYYATPEQRAQYDKMQQAYNLHRQQIGNRLNAGSYTPPKEYASQFADWDKHLDSQLPKMYRSQREAMLAQYEKDPSFLASLKENGFAADHWTADDYLKHRYPHLYRYDRLQSKHTAPGRLAAPREFDAQQDEYRIQPVFNDKYPMLERPYEEKFVVNNDGTVAVNHVPTKDLRGRIAELMNYNENPNMGAAAGWLNKTLSQNQSPVLGDIASGPRKAVLRQAGLPVNTPIDQWSDDQVAKAHMLIGDTPITHQDMALMNAGGDAKAMAASAALNQTGKALNAARPIAAAAKIPPIPKVSIPPVPKQAPNIPPIPKSAPNIPPIPKSVPGMPPIPKPVPGMPPIPSAPAAQGTTWLQRLQSLYKTPLNNLLPKDVPAHTGSIGSYLRQTFLPWTTSTFRNAANAGTFSKHIMPKSTSNLAGFARWLPQRAFWGGTVFGVDRALDSRWSNDPNAQSFYETYPMARSARLVAGEAGSYVPQLSALRWGLTPTITAESALENEKKRLKNKTMLEYDNLSPEEQQSAQRRTNVMQGFSALPFGRGMGHLANYAYEKIPDLDFNSVPDAVEKLKNYAGSPTSLNQYQNVSMPYRLSGLGLRNEAEYNLPEVQQALNQSLEKMKTMSEFSRGGSKENDAVSALRGAVDQARETRKERLLNDLVTRTNDPQLKAYLKTMNSTIGTKDEAKGTQAYNLLLQKLRNDPATADRARKIMENAFAVREREIQQLPDVNKLGPALSNMAASSIVPGGALGMYALSKSPLARDDDSNPILQSLGAIDDWMAGKPTQQRPPANTGLGKPADVASAPTRTPQEIVNQMRRLDAPALGGAAVGGGRLGVPQAGGVGKGPAGNNAIAGTAKSNMPGAPNLNTDKSKAVMEHWVNTAGQTAAAKAKAMGYENLQDPVQRQKFFADPNVRKEAAKALLYDNKFKAAFPNEDPEKLLQVSLGVWDRMSDTHKMLFWGGLSVAAIGLITSMMGGDDEEGGSSFLGPLLGLGGAALAGGSFAHGSTGGRPQQVLTGDYWSGLGKDIGLNQLPLMGK